MKTFNYIYLLLALTITLSGCGGSSGSSTQSKTTKISSKVMASSVLSSYTSHQLVLTLNLDLSIPNGVSPSGNTVTLSSGTDPKMILSSIHSTPSTSPTNWTLSIAFLNSDGFKPSDTLDIQLEYPDGLSLKPENFELTKFDYETINASKTTNSYSLTSAERAKLLKVEIP